MKTGFRFGGQFIMDCYDKNGKWKWQVKSKNMIVNEGLDHALDCLFTGAGQVSPWYVALIETDTAPASGMTYAVPTYTESTAYDEAARQAYVEAAAASQSITNSANRAVFTMSATKTIYGAALVSFATKGNTAEAGAILFCYARFTNAKSVNDDDTLEVTYTIGSADDGV